MKYATEFVLRINEIWHDVEACEYENRHSYFEDEKNRWKKIGKLFIANNSENLYLLDIGSGTGFIPLQIAEFLKKDDLLICSDISENMLNVCKKNIFDKKFKCDFGYIKLDGNRIDLESNRFDFITLNSVLHHIPDFSTFFKEINRLLKLNGRLIISCEPNKAFYTHKFLWNNYKVISFVFAPKQFILEIFRILNLAEIARKVYQKLNSQLKAYNRIVEEVNKRLLEEGIIRTPLKSDIITEIVDIHSPSAGGYHKDRGIDLSEIMKVHLQNFKIEYHETYNHLSKVSFKNRITKLYDSFLKKKYPKTGAAFCGVLKKVVF